MFSLKDFALTGKKAIVTGGGRGLCRGMAEALHEAGAEVTIWDVSPEAAQTAAEIGTHGESVHFVQVDLTQTEEIDKAVVQSIEMMGRIDILVNGAGIQYRAPVLEFPEKMWRAVLEVNLTSMFLVSQRIGRLMCEQRSGRIINIASMCSVFGSVNISAYSASKGGVAQLTKALSNEWAGKGVNVNAIAPGYMRTKITADMQEKSPRQYEEITNRIPMGRWGEAEDLQGLVVFLAADASAYMTGAVIPVDGGYLAK